MVFSNQGCFFAVCCAFLRGVDLEKGYGADRAYKIRMAKNNKPKAKEIKPGNNVKGK